MKQVLVRISRDIKAYGLIIGVLFAIWLLCTLCFGTACIFVFVTGLPCPGCGIGHALLSLLTGQVLQAHTYNPSIWIWLAFGMSFCLYRYVFGKQMSDTHGRWMWWSLTVVSLVSVAIYLYRMVNLFPTKPPLTYYEGNLFQRMFPMYEVLIRKLFGIE